MLGLVSAANYLSFNSFKYDAYLRILKQIQCIRQSTQMYYTLYLLDNVQVLVWFDSFYVRVSTITAI